jgi:hypothetical protein
MITPNDLRRLAFRLVGRHGAVALNLAESAVRELEAKGEVESADAWRALKSVVADVLAGRLPPGKLTIH